MDHVKAGSDPPPLAHTKVHLPPVLLYLHKHRSFTEGKEVWQRGVAINHLGPWQVTLPACVDNGNGDCTEHEVGLGLTG